MKQLVWKLLESRSVAHRFWSPTRKNTMFSLCLIILGAPIALVLSPLSLVFATAGKKFEIYELRVYGEFAWLVDHLERVRKAREGKSTLGFILVRSSLRHEGLSHLYRVSLKCLVMWPSGLSALCAQVLLLQPRNCLKKVIISPDHVSAYPMAEALLKPTRRIIRVRQKTLEAIGCNHRQYVAAAVFTSTKEEVADVNYQSKYKQRESVGTELTESVDFLKARGIEVILLGFGDSGKAHIPREFPRLVDFAKIGGPHEVALASGCMYFWTDGDVGAQWLGQPFQVPVLSSNGDFCWSKTLNLPMSASKRWLAIPTRYRSKSGQLLTFREIMRIEDHGKAVASGQIFPIRASSKEIIEAHREMAERVSNSWIENETTLVQESQLTKMFSEIATHDPKQISSYFLSQHSYLLD